MLTDFQGSIAVKNYERAAQLLDEQAAGPEAEALWMSLCNHALDDVNLDIAERCWERLNNAARAEFLRKTMGPRCPLGPQGAPSSSGQCSESSPRSLGPFLADDRQEHDELVPARRDFELRADDRDHAGLMVDCPAPYALGRPISHQLQNSTEVASSANSSTTSAEDVLGFEVDVCAAGEDKRDRFRRKGIPVFQPGTRYRPGMSRKDLRWSSDCDSDVKTPTQNRGLADRIKTDH